MLHKFRQQFGSAGLAISIAALVVALAGGAYAATQPGARHKKAAPNTGLTKKQTQQVTALIAAKGGGPPGTPGTPGAPGAKGGPGPEGKPGAPGANVVTFPIAKGPSDIVCNKQGGTEFEVEGKGKPEHLCNGNPAELPPTLPAGVTETGAWAASGNAAGEEAYSPISFPIKLAGFLESAEVKFVTAAQQSAKSVPNCQGKVGTPTAATKTLCVYEGSLGGAGIPEIYELTNLLNGASATGAFLFFKSTEAWFGTGSWAVTG